MEVEDVCSPTCSRRAETGLKVALVSTLFLLVLGGAGIHQVTLLIMANQVSVKWHSPSRSLHYGNEFLYASA